MDSDKYIGRLLDNRYEIQEVIGIGGMAVVYKARCHRLNRLVAIKILKDDYCQDEEFRRRFQAEGQAVAMLSHPNIVSVYDVSSSDTADYIVMELIDGISLKQYMEKKGVLNWKETLHFAIQIGKALEHAHSRGIVHRDIKPHNVMVLKNGSVKVTDFGIARVMSKGNTLTKEALGSVHYISPEQAKGGHVDNRSDIYSLGVVMYEMMTGRPPYDGESPVAVAIQHINGGAPMPSTLNPNIPEGMEQIIMKAMAHEPSQRYSSATEMLYDMDEFRKNPGMLFAYNAPGLEDVPHLPPKPPAPPQPRTTAEAVAAGRAGQARKSGQARPRQDPARRPENRKPAPRPRNTDAEDTRNRVATIAVIACSVVAIIAIVIFLFTIFQDGVTGPAESYVKVPTFIGKRYESIGTQDGIIIGVPEQVYDEQVEKGYVIDQKPAPGEKVVRDTEVKLVVSLGKRPKTKTMENLVDLDKTVAENFLTNQGLHALIREEYSEDAPAGKVTRTEPAYGEPLEDGQTVTLWISKGPEIVKNFMPNTVGLNVATAQRVLENAGFLYYEIEPVDSSAPKDEVVWQSEEKNTKVDVNTVIVLKVSNGPTEPPTEPTTEPTVPPTGPSEPTVPTTPSQPPVQKTVKWMLLEGTAENYTLTVKDLETGETVHTEIITPGKSFVQLTLTGTGERTYKLYINGEWYKDETVNFGNG